MFAEEYTVHNLQQLVSCYIQYSVLSLQWFLFLTETIWLGLALTSFSYTGKISLCRRINFQHTAPIWFKTVCSLNTELSHNKQTQTQCSPADIKNVHNLYNTTLISVTTEKKQTEYEAVNRGIRQGSSLSQLLFIIYMNTTIQKWRQ
jgi:hypothetical protein